MSTPGRSSRADPVVRFVEDFTEAFSPVVDVVRHVWSELRPALEPYAALAEAVERGEVKLEPPPPGKSCHCLCGMHRSAGMFCAVVVSDVVTLTGGFHTETPVPMCRQCAIWWRHARTERVIAGTRGPRADLLIIDDPAARSL